MTPGVASAHPPRRRLQLVLLLGVVFWALLAARLFKLQILDHELFLRYADREHWGRVELPAERGAILDRDHHILAHNVVSRSLVARPRAMLAAAAVQLQQQRRAEARAQARARRPRPPGPAPARSALPAAALDSLSGRPADSLVAEAAWALAPRLGTSAPALEERMRSRPSFVYLARQMEADQDSSLVRGGPLPPGVTLEPETRRIHPMGSVAQEIIGSTDIDGRPLGGVEKQLDDLLRGSPGWVTTFRDGRWLEHRVPERGMRAPVPGYTLELTLSADYQAIVEERLHAAIREHGARGGSVVLMDPNTGEILALANEAVGSDGRLAPAPDRAITDMFEPGSTFKMVVYAAALEEHRITRNTPLNCEGGTWYLGRGKPIHDDRHDHFYTVPAWYALMKSSNIGAGKVGLMLGPDRLVDFARRMGFGAATGVDLPGEGPGYLAKPGPRQDRQLASICFGQGVSVTMLQLAMAYGAVANGGVLMRPRILRALYDERGQLVKRLQPEPVRRVLSERTAAELRGLLQAVVDSGTASAARLGWAPAAGKTGTAQKAAPHRGGYAQGRYMSLFVGFMPVDRPRLLMLTMVDEPQGQHYGGVVAAPVFRDVMEALARSGTGPVSPPLEVITPQAHPLAGGPGQAQVPDVRGEVRRSAVRRVAEAGLTAAVVGGGDRVLRTEPAPGSWVLPGSVLRLWTEGAVPADAGVPEVVGLPLREALGRLRESALLARVVGGGRVTRQEPAAGSPVRAGLVVTLYADEPR
ncbi:MAG TPA: penicillin-binding transpeptidase domain-containing protein [Candidatus Saccharimonadales bacterium]|nr:penicillin-binding transpeptidase domain-containing protein [Candidatus Saccharimonadales bacterium]